ncbi:MAG TPA: MFS transporter [Chloroflexota bacterium]|nr:MFS transporter [Chloroflexota bacterium]
MSVAIRFKRPRFTWTVKMYMLSVVFFGLGTSIFDLVYNLHLLQLGFTASDLGTLWAIGLAVMSVCAIPVGLLADRLGRRWFFVGGSLLFGVSMLAVPFTTSLTALVVLQVLNAIGAIAMFTTETATMAGEVDPDQQTVLFSSYYVVYMLADGVGSFLGGQLPYHLPSGVSTYQITLLIAGCLGMGIGVIRLFLRLRPVSLGGATGQQRTRPMLPNQAMLRLALLAFLIGGSATLAMRYLNVVLQDGYGWDVGAIGQIFVLLNVIGFVGAAATPGLSQKLGSARSAGFAMLLIGGAQIAAALSPTALILVVPLLLRQAAHYFQMPILETFAVGRVAPEVRSAMASYREIGFFLGGALSAKCYAAFLETGGYAQAFLLSAVLALAAAAMYRVFYDQRIGGVSRASELAPVTEPVAP